MTIKINISIFFCLIENLLLLNDGALVRCLFCSWWRKQILVRHLPLPRSDGMSCGAFHSSRYTSIPARESRLVTANVVCSTLHPLGFGSRLEGIFGISARGRGKMCIWRNIAAAAAAAFLLVVKLVVYSQKILVLFFIVVRHCGNKPTCLRLFSYIFFFFLLYYIETCFSLLGTEASSSSLSSLCALSVYIRFAKAFYL